MMGLEELIPTIRLAAEVGLGVMMGGVVVFVLIYFLRKTIPDMQRAHSEAMQAKDKAHVASDLAKDIRQAEEIRQARTDFREALERVIADSQRGQERILAHCQSEARMREEIMRGEVAEVSAAITDFRRTLEEFRDALGQIPRRRGGGRADPSAE